MHEVVNGLLEKSHGNVGIDLVDGTLPEKFNALPLNVRVGIIPAGKIFDTLLIFKLMFCELLVWLYPSIMLQ